MSKRGILYVHLYFSVYKWLPVVVPIVVAVGYLEI